MRNASCSETVSVHQMHTSRVVTDGSISFDGGAFCIWWSSSHQRTVEGCAIFG